MREIVLDTETTGLDPHAAHKIVEVACVELVNHMQTGNHFHVYVNPQRDMPDEAFRIHGLSAEFLSQHEVFGAIAADLLTFIGGSPLVIHNAGFDMKFLNYELRAAGFPSLESHPVVDTLPLARRAFPGAQASLDALCRRFKIDLSRRSKHGALLDAELLAHVYLELKGGKQRDLAFHKAPSHGGAVTATSPLSLQQSRPRRSFPLSAEDERLHQAFLDTFKNNLWHR